MVTTGTYPDQAGGLYNVRNISNITAKANAITLCHLTIKHLSSSWKASQANIATL